MDYKFESSLMKRKSEAQEKLDKLKIDFLKQLNVLENMDNTNSDIIPFFTLTTILNIVKTFVPSSL